MKKVIGLCLVLLISSVSVFAQDGKRGAKKGGDPAQRCEKMIADLKLDEKQAADFRKVEAEFRDMSLRDDRDAEMKKILTEDQYKQYLEKQRPQSPRKRHGRKE